MSSSVGIGAAIGRENRPTTQIGSDVDYAGVVNGVRAVLLGVFLLLVTLVVLSLVVHVEEVAAARGDFVPVQRVQVLQTLEGGQLASTYVRNDDRVRAGQIIAKFRDTEPARDLTEVEAKQAKLQIDIEQLDAFATNRTPNLDKYRTKYGAMVDAAMALNKEQVLRLQSEVSDKDEQIAGVQAALNGAQQKIPNAKSSMQSMIDLQDRTREGVRAGIIAVNRQAAVDEQESAAEQAYIALVSSLDGYEARIKALEAEKDATVAQAISTARNQRADLIGQLDAVEAQLQADQSRAADTEIRAPVNGLVHNMSDTPVGTVIPAGGTVCEIVPTDGGVLMQARISSRDIGFVHVGQKVIVKADAFDYGRFGGVEGHIARISPESSKGAGGEAFFMAEIDLNQGYVGTDDSHMLTPGMTGDASIQTGEKSIFQYLLKPIYVGLDSALKER